MRNIYLILLSLIVPFTIMAQSGFVQEGKASFYADKFEGRTTASGERYSHAKSTCAHLNLPFGSLVRVTSTANGQSVVVRVNDRGPFVANRIIDLSRSAAEKLGFIQEGVADVRIEVVNEDEGVTSKLNAYQPPAKPEKKLEEPAKPKPAIAQVASGTKAAQPVAEGGKKQPNQTPSQTFASQKQDQQLVAPVQQKMVNTGDASEMELYELRVTKQPPGGFAIQLGSYKELVNLLRIADDLKTSLKKEVRVQVATINGEKIYRLMVGEFNTRKDADAFKVKASQIYPDCFVVELK